MSGPAASTATAPPGDGRGPLHAPGTADLRDVAREARPLLSLALPIVVGLAGATAMGLVDTLMIAPLGTIPLAATSVAVAVVVIAFSAIYGVLSVVGVRVAQGFGAQDPRRVSFETRTGLLTALVSAVAGVAIMAVAWPLLRLTQPPEVMDAALGYYLCITALLVPFALVIAVKQAMDAIDRPWTGTAITFVAVAANIPLSLALIYGFGPVPALGLVGAGIGSVLAESLAAALAWGWWMRAPSFARHRAPVSPTWTGAARQLREGGPLAFAYTAEGASWSVAGLMLGVFGAGALAAHQILSSITSVTYMIPLGMAAAVSVRIGQATGAGQSHRVRAIGLSALGLVTIYSLVTMAVYLTLGRTFAALISDDAQVVATAAAMFATLALMQVMDGVQSTAVGALRGLLDTGTATAVSLVAYWIVALPAAWALAVWAGFGPAWVWVGYAAGLSVAAIWLPWRFLWLTRLRGPASSAPS